VLVFLLHFGLYTMPLISPQMWQAPTFRCRKLTEGKQFIVGSKNEAIAFYKQANYMDCRFAAYPYNVNNSVPQIIDFVMLDLDLNNFRFSRQKLDRALHKILISLKKQDIEPTVMWSGNGYHVLVPIKPLQSTLEDMVEFAKFEEPSKSVLRFLEKYLSYSKSDCVHNSTVSFGNCMLRVPGSFNSKYNNDKKNQVLLVKKWNNQRLSIKPLLGDFLAYLLDKKDEKKLTYAKYYKKNNNNNLLSKI
jgi:hypothetical protein